MMASNPNGSSKPPASTMQSSSANSNNRLRVFDKENGFNLNLSGSLGKSKKVPGIRQSRLPSKPSPLGMRPDESPLTRRQSPSLFGNATTAIRRNDRSPLGFVRQDESPLPSRPSPSIPKSSSSSSTVRKNVLRFGETIESFFGLSESSAREHVSLCRSIVDGTAADDPTAWIRALELSCSSNNKINGTEKVRLYRRATSRFNHYVDHLSTDRHAVFRLWIAYAKSQMEQKDFKDARHTLEHIRNLKLGQHDAEYYVVLSELEHIQHDKTAAIRTLQNAIDSKIEPQSALRQAMGKLMEELPTPLSSKKKRRPPMEQSFSPKRTKFVHNDNDELQNKKVEAVAIEENDATDNSNMSFGTIGRLSPSGDLDFDNMLGASNGVSNPIGKADNTVLDQEKNVTESAKGKVLDGSHALADAYGSNKKPETSLISSRKSEVTTEKSTPFRPFLNISSSRVVSASRVIKKPPLLVKAPKLAQLGKAKRVDPNQSSIEDEDSDTESTSEIEGEKPAVSKMDLTYIYQWDPMRHRHKQQPESDDTATKRPPEDEESRTKPLSNASNHAGESAAPTNHSNSSVNQDGGSSALSDQSNLSTSSHFSSNKRSSAGSAPQQNEHCQIRSDAGSSVNCSKSQGTYNQNFLPLVEERNMLRINQAAYAKLGVIGKGGSCKVYRALDKDCNVYAIKKVKIAGMDEKAIAGYSNEISLLKRLRGNPAIIQLFDSQVDLRKKAIYLVMEVGEVDLNHVLQQQATESPIESGMPRKLNMNFIRLTWQQMLSAVHCIHEERIIHGDLKPANFLFVRGVLKLIDFGIAKAIQSDDTTNIYRENQIGTLNYMSPEAILNSDEGIKIGRASDIWSLGCILYQMIVGRTPFAELHMLQKLQAIVNPKHAIQYPNGVDPCAVEVIKLCLRRNPSERPPIVGAGGLLNESVFLN